MNCLTQLLKEKSGEIVFESMAVLKRSHLEHYDAEGLEKLYNLTLQCIAEKKMIKMIDYVENTARERDFNDYYLFEILTAINILEETIWKKIINELRVTEYAASMGLNSTVFKDIPVTEYTEALGLIITIMGDVKETLARSCVSLARNSKTPSIDLKKLFSVYV